jgi:hypothetical protein
VSAFKRINKADAVAESEMANNSALFETVFLILVKNMFACKLLGHLDLGDETNVIGTTVAMSQAGAAMPRFGMQSIDCKILRHLAKNDRNKIELARANRIQV